MSRISYDREGTSPLRWFVALFLAAGLTIFVVVLARLGAQNFCGAACDPLDPFGAFLREPFPVFGDMLDWCMGLAIILGVLLWLALGSGQNALSVILLLALVALGLAMADEDILPPVAEAPELPVLEGEAEPVAPTETLTITMPGQEEEPIVAEEPLPEVLAEVEPEPVNQCPAGNFWNGEGCSTCEVTETVAAASKLNVAPIAYDAAWDYADDRHFRASLSDAERPIGDLTVNGELAVCEHDAILVVGSASSDGPLERNLNRARNRAARLASHIEAACGTAPKVFALSFGQSTAPRDNFKDRTLTVLGLDAAPGEAISPSAIEEELGYLLGSDAIKTPLFDRLRYFPTERWSWVEGGSGPVSMTTASRPVETVTRLRDGAPESCF